jgi:hypothetical protein
VTGVQTCALPIWSFLGDEELNVSLVLFDDETYTLCRGLLGPRASASSGETS